MIRTACRGLFACGAIALAAGHPASGQDTSAPLSDTEVQQAYFVGYGSGDYLGALAALENIEQSEWSPVLRFTYDQFRPVLDGFVVNAPAGREVSQEELDRLAAAEQRDAIAVIVERARDTRIVIVNETHDNPRDRIFVMELAEALAPQGFTHYAAETFVNFGTDEEREARMEAMRLRGYPVIEDGFYSRGSAFAYSITRIMAAGYRPVSYEWNPLPGDRPDNPRDAVEMRESIQARYLAEAVAAAEPEAKFLIHVGYSHAAELPFPDGQTWMAHKLKALTGIDPLTIDQTDLSQYSRPRHHDVIAEQMGSDPVVLFEDGDPLLFGANAERMDLQVVHPPITAVGGRPDWLARTGRSAIPVPADLMPQQGRALVQVFQQGQGEDAVPIDQVLVNAGDAPPLLYVPADGGYRLAVQR